MQREKERKGFLGQGIAFRSRPTGNELHVSEPYAPACCSAMSPITGSLNICP